MPLQPSHIHEFNPSNGFSGQMFPVQLNNMHNSLESVIRLPTSANLASYFRVVSQTVRIFNLDIAEQTFSLHTEISIMNLSDSSSFIVLKLGQGYYYCFQFCPLFFIRQKYLKYQIRDKFASRKLTL